MKKKIAPSIMCIDFFELDKYIKEFEKACIDLIHIDIMDGSFVPNYTLGTDFVRNLKSKTDIPLDIHLMIENPESKVEWFDFGENDYVSVHYESTRHFHKTIAMIKNKGAKAIAAINPATPIYVLGDILDDISGVLVMTVNPGFAGQKLIDSTIKKIKNLREYLDDNSFGHIEIEVDGNVSFENAKIMSKAGANIFVAGSSSLFCKNTSLETSVVNLRKAINL